MKASDFVHLRLRCYDKLLKIWEDVGRNERIREFVIVAWCGKIVRKSYWDGWGEESEYFEC